MKYNTFLNINTSPPLYTKRGTSCSAAVRSVYVCVQQVCVSIYPEPATRGRNFPAVSIVQAQEAARVVGVSPKTTKPYRL